MINARIALAAGVLILIIAAILSYRSLKAENEMLKQQYAVCQMLTDIQNKAVLDLKKISDDRAAGLKIAETQASQDREKTAKEVSEILAKQIPTDCQAAVQWAAVNAHDIATNWS